MRDRNKYVILTDCKDQCIFNFSPMLSYTLDGLVSPGVLVSRVFYFDTIMKF